MTDRTRPCPAHEPASLDLVALATALALTALAVMRVEPQDVRAALDDLAGARPATCAAPPHDAGDCAAG